MYNAEHYSDPTAGAALAQIRREERSMNSGKRFEADFKASIPPGIWYYRFRDSPATFYGGEAQEGVRFSLDNICDCQLYCWPCLHLIELKTVDTPSAALTSLFGRWLPDKGEYKKQKHLRELSEAAGHRGITASVIIQYRRTGNAYAIHPDAILHFIELSTQGDRKSIPELWCAQSGFAVESRQLRVNRRYDVRGLVARLAEGEGANVP